MAQALANRVRSVLDGLMIGCSFVLMAWIFVIQPLAVDDTVQHVTALQFKGAPDLYSFAAITDDPEPEVAAAGHDRTIINIKPEHVDAWLNPEPGNLAALYEIFDDKRHPYYEHRLAA